MGAGDPVTVGTHCGLRHPSALVQYAGVWWQFENVPAGGNPPPGWGNPEDTIYILSVENGRATALGPDGKEYTLVVWDRPLPENNCL